MAAFFVFSLHFERIPQAMRQLQLKRIIWCGWDASIFEDDLFCQPPA